MRSGDRALLVASILLPANPMAAAPIRVRVLVAGRRVSYPSGA